MELLLPVQCHLTTSPLGQEDVISHVNTNLLNVSRFVCSARTHVDHHSPVESLSLVGLKDDAAGTLGDGLGLLNQNSVGQRSEALEGDHQ